MTEERPVTSPSESGDFAPSLEGAEPANEAFPARTGDLPPLLLAALGLGAFDAMVSVVYIALWGLSPSFIGPIAQRFAGFTLLCGIAAMLLGGICHYRSRRRGARIPGAQWALPAAFAGLALCFVTVFMPAIAALRALMGSISP